MVQAVDGRREPRGQVRLLLRILRGLYTYCATYLLSYYRAWRSKQYYHLLMRPVLLIAYLLCWLRWWRVYDVMPRLSVRYAYEGLMCCLDRWAGWLIWCVTRYPSILQGSIVFQPIITGQVIVSRYSTVYSRSRALMRMFEHITCVVPWSCAQTLHCTCHMVNPSHVLSHSHV